MQLTDWLLVEVALLLIGLTQNLFDKIRLQPPTCNWITSQAVGSVESQQTSFTSTVYL
jgi:hypothetical protein